MNIIIDPEQLAEYQEKYTVLELDTFRILPEKIDYYGNATHRKQTEFA